MSKMLNTKVSVVIPVCNGEKMLMKCLDSVLNQSYENYEVIVIDNNSDDRTKGIVKEFEKNNKKIRYFFEPQIGRGAARNTGERNAKGEVVLMTDADCIVPKDWIKNMIKPILEENYDLVQGFQESLLDNFWTRNMQKTHLLTIRKKAGKTLMGFIDTKNFAIKTSVLREIGFTSRKYVSGNDLHLSIMLEKNKANIKFLKNVKVIHLHPDSFKKLIEKQMYRARWCAKITKDTRLYLNNGMYKILLKEFNQTPFMFISSGFGVFYMAFRDKRNIFYELAFDISWKIGLVDGWLR